MSGCCRTLSGLSTIGKGNRLVLFCRKNNIKQLKTRVISVYW